MKNTSKGIYGKKKTGYIECNYLIYSGRIKKQAEFLFLLSLWGLYGNAIYFQIVCKCLRFFF